ncbi:Serine/threonine-protein phosphatase 6 regulatory ankyrin repeat subunit B [Linum perenne]
MAAGDGLFEKVMKGRWKEILGVDAFNLSEKITQSEDTALHIAVMNGKTDVVIRLVENMKGMASSILKTKNVKGNTCLHLAASIGDVDMCHCIASRDWTLITEVNNDGETPLFLASLNGKKGAFFTLRSLAEGKLDDKYKLCRRFDGNTILHSAIYGEHYGLALEIIKYYPNLVNSVNETGSTPLHVLAMKPNSFASNFYLGLFDRIIYYCKNINPLMHR